MTEQRIIPVELLEDLLEFLLCHSNRWDGFTKHPQLIVEQARAIINGPGVEPVAYVRYSVGAMPDFIPVIAGKPWGDISGAKPLGYLYDAQKQTAE